MGSGSQINHAFLGGGHLYISFCILVITIAKTLGNDLLELHVPKQSEEERSWNILDTVKTKDFNMAGAQDA